MNNIFLLSPWCAKPYVAPLSNLLYLKYFLKDHGYDAEIINCSLYDEKAEDVLSTLKGGSKPIIGVTSSTRDRFHAYNIIRKIRSEIPDSLIVVGGRHFGFLAEETLQELPEVDIVVRGEGEITLKEICDSVYNNESFQDILGVSYRSENEIRHNPDRPLAKNIDIFRNYDMDFLLTSNRAQVLSPTKCDSSLYFSVFASRGCPGSCIFCCQGPTKVRFRSLNSIMREIEDKIEITGVRNLAFGDSSFTINKRYVHEFCERVIENELNIRWSCYTRADIDIDLLKVMRKAGLVSIEMGLESASPSVLKETKKKIKLDHVENICKSAYELGIKVFLFCMISLPSEKIEDVNLTISFVKRLSPYIYNAGLQVTRIMPDAAIFNVAIGRGVLGKNFNWFKAFTVAEEMRKIEKGTLDNSVPLYLEHLNIDEVKNKLDEFKKIRLNNFSYFTTLKGDIKTNLSRAVLRNLTFPLFIQKFRRAPSKFYGAWKNWQKSKVLK